MLTELLSDEMLIREPPREVLVSLTAVTGHALCGAHCASALHMTPPLVPPGPWEGFHIISQLEVVTCKHLLIRVIHSQLSLTNLVILN